ncbi:GNAT family N-acetyltransferase [Actinokineospora enzanensis]|uniref:GNAT family N-acetyltransferase n=1 Tax=Actinokineospora enzanensis TaxID=155975 RepID=UPI00037B94D6|nr:GNAT family N-acetyltransferase [Actinokineospora enzanensis]
MTLVVSRFEPAAAADAVLRGYYEVMRASQARDRVDEPRLTYENCVGRLRTPFAGLGPVAHWIATAEGEIVGLATVYLMEGPQNGQLAVTDIQVHPRHRRKGVGTEVLRTLLPWLRENGRTVVEYWQVTKNGDGEHWARGLGMRTTYHNRLQALSLAEHDPKRWRPDTPRGYRLVQWDDAAPDELLESYVRVHRAMRDAPHEGMAYQAPEWTVEGIRAREAEFRESGVRQRVVVAVHERTGEVAGFTELEQHPHRPRWGYQRDTGVLSAHRGHGLGYVVKSRMLTWLLADVPDLELVFTGSNAGNTHMLRVNAELGYTVTREMIAVNQDIDALAVALGRTENDSIGSPS